MSEKRPELHNSDLFLKPEFTESNEYVQTKLFRHQKELNLDTFQNSLLLQKPRFYNKKGPSLGENNHIKTLYTSDLLPRLKAEQKSFYKKSYLNKAVTLYSDPPISAESEVRKKRRLESVSQRSRSRIDKPKYEIKGQGQLSPLKYKLGSGFLFYDKAQLESQNKYYLRSSHFAESTERSISDQTSISQNYKKSDLLLLSSSKHTSPSLNAESNIINSMQTENQLQNKVHKLGYSVFNKRSLSYKSKFLLNLPSLIRSGISREFLLVAINLVLLSILAIVQRNNYGFCKNGVIRFTNSVPVAKGSSPGSNNILCASKTPNINTSARLRSKHKVFTVPFCSLSEHRQDQKQEEFVGVFLGELNNYVRSSKYKQMPLQKLRFCRSVNGKENFLSLPQFAEPELCSGQVSKNSPGVRSALQNEFCTNKNEENLQSKDTVFAFTKKINTDRFKFTAEKGKNPSLLFSSKPLNSHFTKTEFWLSNLLPPAKVDCVIKPWYCMKAYNTLNDNIVATRSVQEKVDNSTIYKNPKIQGFQYYTPYYTNQERIFAESDTIPSKRGTIYSKIVKKLHTLENSLGVTKTKFSEALQNEFCVFASRTNKSEENLPKQSKSFLLGNNFNIEQNVARLKEADKQKFVTTWLKTPQNGFAQAKEFEPKLMRYKNEVFVSGEKSSGRSSITTSQFILKRFFYKYGFFVIEPLKKDLFLSKEEQNYLTQSPYTKNIKQLGITETKNNTINQIHDRHKTKFCDGLAKHFAQASTSTSDSQILPQKIQVNVKSSCIPGDHINLALYRNVNTPYFLPSVNQRVAPVLPKPFVTEDTYSQGLSASLKNIIKGSSTVKSKYSPVFTRDSFSNSSKPHGRQNNRLIKKIFFVWSKYNLYQVKPNAFAEVKSSISTFNFIPDTRVQNISVSGYKFPELTKKEIVYLFRQRAILDFYLYFNFFTKSENFGMSSKSNKNEVLRSLSVNKPKVCFPCSLQKLRFCKDLFNEPDLSIIDPKMQYTQVNLDSIRNVKEIFSRMGRNYENYLRQPKDSLPALIISPSLEDDREIEEEGIQIFRKRDLIKNTKNAINTGNAKQSFAESVGRSAESKILSEHGFREKGDLNPNNTSFFTTQELNSKKTESKSEIQNRQILVKNALRQAQEEIDNIAKKEEKGSDKDKQVIPPLTRLEALYTIRNRERKREQAKDLTSSKGTTSFEELFLYSDKQTDVVVGATKTKFSEANMTKSPHIHDALKSASNGLTEPKHNCIFTSWLFSKLGDENIGTDRKHSFFGEMSLLPKKLTAQEQKQIFQQKTNPLLKVNDVVVGVRSALQNEFCTNKNEVQPTEALQNKVHKLWFDSRTGNSDQQKMVNLDITQSPRFQIGTRLLPETMLGLQNEVLHSQGKLFKSLPSPIYFYNNLSQNKACQASAPKIKGTPLGSPVYHRVWQPKRMEPSTFRVSSRSQSTPVIPRISQKDWKNMIKWQLKKYFFEEDRRLLSLSLNKNNLKIKKINLYFPWISIQKAENIVNNQALVTTNEENAVFLDDVVVGVRSALQNKFCTNKNKAVSGNEWPLTRLDLRTSNPYKNEVFVNLTDKSTQLHGKTNNYWRLPVQQTLFTITWPVKTQQKGHVQVKKPQKELGIGKKVCNSSILFESVTTYSWLFVYTFVFVLMFKQLFNFVYKVGFKDFFIKFLNSDFGRTITGEEFRYSIQNLPLTESYMPKKRLQELLGLEKNQVQLLEIVWFLRNNCQGRNGPRGILLVGPPGVENVSVVQAIAGEAKVPIIVQSLEKIAQDNEPQRQLEQLYMRAHKQAPCVLFLDQLDTIGARRDQLFKNKRQAHNLSSSMASISDQKEHNVNTEMQNSVNSGNKLNVVLRLLTILDGITQSSGVVTVATAQDLSKLDPALLRPKRFDRRIYLSLPNQQDRVNLFKIQTQSIGHIKKMPWDYLSLQTENMSTADIKSAINYSLFRAVLKNSVHTLETLEYGIDCVKTLTNKRIHKK